MLVGILSDTHDQVERTRAAVKLLMAEGATALIHCGDLTGPDVVYECCHAPSYFVFGNCDLDRKSLQEAIATINGTCLNRGGIITLDGRKIAVTHGDSESELNRLIQLEPDYLLTGHTHRAADARQGTIRRINPGALHRASQWTVALLDLASNHLRVLPLINTTMHH